MFPYSSDYLFICFRRALHFRSLERTLLRSGFRRRFDSRSGVMTLRILRSQFTTVFSSALLGKSFTVFTRFILGNGVMPLKAYFFVYPVSSYPKAGIVLLKNSYKHFGWIPCCYPSDLSYRSCRSTLCSHSPPPFQYLRRGLLKARH